MSEENEDTPLDETSDSHDDETPDFEEVEEQIELAEHVEPVDPLEEAIQRAETAEKEIAYKDAEIQNVRKRLMAEKSALIQYGGMGLARRMIPILNDVDRALSQVDEDDESPVAQGLRLLRNKLWRELEADGIKAIDARGNEFNPATMEAITTIPASEQFPAGQVIDVLEPGYMYKERVLRAARVVVATE